MLQLLKPAHPKAPALKQENPPQRKALATELESSPCSLQLEKAHVLQQRPNTVKTK